MSILLIYLLLILAQNLPESSYAVSLDPVTVNIPKIHFNWLIKDLVPDFCGILTY